MKICALTHTYPRFPGDVNAPFVETLMEYIARRGNEVAVLTAFDSLWNRSKDDHTVELRTYRYIWPSRYHILGYSRTIEGNISFRKRVLLLAPFLVISASFSFLQLVRERKPDILHAHWIVPNGFIAAVVSKVTGVPLLIQTHGSDVFTAEHNPLFRRMACFAASQARCIVSPSPDIMRRLDILGVESRKMVLVPNTVEADFASNVSMDDVSSLKASLGIPPGNTVILALGRMVYVKGFDYLIDAFRSIVRKRSAVTLILAGDGVLFDELKKKADKLVGDSIIMPGEVKRNMVPVYFKAADIFVVPSIRHESGAVDGLPVVVPEAMSTGLPIVATSAGGIPVLVRDGFNGFLVVERDSIALENALCRLLDDPGLRRFFGENARRIIVENVNYDIVSHYFCRLYECLLGGVSPEDFPQFNIALENKG